MKRSLIALSVLSLLGQNAFADVKRASPTKEERALKKDLEKELDLELENDFQIALDGEVNASNFTGDYGGANFNESYVSLSTTYKNRIRTVITAKLEEIFKENEVKLSDDFSLGEFIKEAYIEIREINGAPVAVIIGKQPVAFGQNVQAMPLFKNNPLSRLQEIREVFGLTVELSEGLFGLFDQVEVSVFESQDKDFEIGKVDGLSIRISKALTENWLATLSHAEQGNTHLSTRNEKRSSVGLIGETSDGSLVGWAEGIFFSNNPEYSNSSFGITAGGMIRVHETTDIIVEYNYIEKEVRQIGLGVMVSLRENISLGAEVRYSDYVSKKDEFSFGLNVSYTFGSTGRVQNETSIFGKDSAFDEDDLLD